MTIAFWVLVGLLGLAGALAAWAAREDWQDRHGPPRTARHAYWVSQGATRRLPRMDPPTEVIPGAVARGRCHCLHLAHIGRCRAAKCGCVSPEGYTDPRTL